MYVLQPALFLQVEASLEEQAFTEAWGKEAKELYNDTVMASFEDPQLKKIIQGIRILGPANLSPAEREQVSLYIYQNSIYIKGSSQKCSYISQIHS